MKVLAFRKEYEMKVSNAYGEQNGWIPISLGFFPEDYEVVQTTYLGYYDKKPRCDSLAYRSNGVWYCADSNCFEVEVEIIAWKHLCDPYQPKQKTKVKVERRKKNELRKDKE